MKSGNPALILWVGPKHSGKTTTAARLTVAMRRSRYTVGGFLAPSIYHEEQLTGFDILDLQSRRRARLAERRPMQGDVVGFTFCERGLQLGRQALQSAAGSPVDLAIVDEFGPLELDGRGWRNDVDSLLKSNLSVLLLVVRNEVVPSIRQLYGTFSPHIVRAADPRAIPKVKAVLEAVMDGVRAHGSRDSERSCEHLT